MYVHWPPPNNLYYVHAVTPKKHAIVCVCTDLHKNKKLKQKHKVESYLKKLSKVDLWPLYMAVLTHTRMLTQTYTHACMFFLISRNILTRTKWFTVILYLYSLICMGIESVFLTFVRSSNSPQNKKTLKNMETTSMLFLDSPKL